jgi:hypothetical protein
MCCVAGHRIFAKKKLTESSDSSSSVTTDNASNSCDQNGTDAVHCEVTDAYSNNPVVDGDMRSRFYNPV